MQTFLVHFAPIFGIVLQTFWRSFANSFGTLLQRIGSLLQTFLLHFCQTVLLAHFFKHFWRTFGTFLAHFRNALEHFCKHFWCMIATFLVHFATILLAHFIKHFWRNFPNIFGALFWHTFANFLAYTSQSYSDRLLDSKTWDCFQNIHKCVIDLYSPSKTVKQITFISIELG